MSRLLKTLICINNIYSHIYVKYKYIYLDTCISLLVLSSSAYMFEFLSGRFSYLWIASLLLNYFSRVKGRKFNWLLHVYSFFNNPKLIVHYLWDPKFLKKMTSFIYTYSPIYDSFITWMTYVFCIIVFNGLMFTGFFLLIYIFILFCMCWTSWIRNCCE